MNQRAYVRPLSRAAFDTMVDTPVFYFHAVP